MTDFKEYSELYHYGVKGMHWGIRRFQPYPAGHKGGQEVGEAARSEKGPRIGHMIRSVRNSQRLLNEREYHMAKKDLRTKLDTGEIGKETYKGKKLEAKQQFKTKRREKLIITSDEQLKETYNRLSKEVREKVPYQNVKRGLHIANKILTAYGAASVGAQGSILTAAGAVTGNPAALAAGIGTLIGGAFGTPLGYAIRNGIRRQFT